MWNWDFGDGNTSSEQNTTHSYAAAGKYNVTLEVMGMGSNAITKVISVVVSKPAVATAAKAPCAAFSTCISAVLHQLDQKIIYPHYDFKHLTESILKSE